MASTPRILEIGEFSLFKRAWPARTTFLFTGANAASVRDLEQRPFSFALVPGLLRSLRRGDYDLVACHAPSRPLWDRRLDFPRALAALLRRLVRPRTFGTRWLHKRPVCAFAVLDYHDASTLTPSALPLLAACDAYFKRELPLDPAAAFVGAAPHFDTTEAVARDPSFRHAVDKLLPLSLAMADERARRALATDGAKTADVFFAGTLAHSPLRTRGAAELAGLVARGLSIDLGEGGLAPDAYLDRCARAWLAWSPAGYGWECFRHYEAALCATVPLLTPPPIRRHRPLEAGMHALVYPVEEGGLTATVLRALADKPALARMGAAARAHALAHHTHARVGEYVVDATLRAATARG